MDISKKRKCCKILIRKNEINTFFNKTNECLWIFIFLFFFNYHIISYFNNNILRDTLLVNVNYNKIDLYNIDLKRNNSLRNLRYVLLYKKETLCKSKFASFSFLLRVNNKHYYVDFIFYSIICRIYNFFNAKDRFLHSNLSLNKYFLYMSINLIYTFVSVFLTSPFIYRLEDMKTYLAKSIKKRKTVLLFALGSLSIKYANKYDHTESGT